MPTNWKYIKKQLEKEFLCEKLRGHITYDLTDYRPAPWYQQHFIMKYDDEVLLDIRQPKREWDKRYTGMQINWRQREKIVEMLCDKYVGDNARERRNAEKLVNEAITEADKIVSHHKGVFGVEDVIDAIGVYLHTDIDDCLGWTQEDLVRALAILDRRCGKRRLQKMSGYNRSGFYVDYPNWLKRIFQIRFEAEGLKYHKMYETYTGGEKT